MLRREKGAGEDGAKENKKDAFHTLIFYKIIKKEDMLFLNQRVFINNIDSGSV